MLFDSSVRKELARSFAATLVVILTIVITMMLIRVLGNAAKGSIPPQEVVLFLGFSALAHLPTMLSLSLFVAVVLTLGRLYRDSEMPVWFASGVSLSRFIRPVAWTAAPVLAVIVLLLAFVWPWVNARTLEVREQYEQRSDLSRVSPGVFQSSSDGRRVFFIERDASSSDGARNVFIVARRDTSDSVTSARGGRIEERDADRFLLLESGQRHETDGASGERTIARFEEYRVLVDEGRARQAQARPPKAMSTADLLSDPTPLHDAELAWRFGLMLGAANLLLAGIGLAATHPRRASNWNLVFALLAFVVYFNLVNLSQAWVADARLPLGPALIGLHGAVFLAALALIAWRERGTTWAWRLPSGPPWGLRR